MKTAFLYTGPHRVHKAWAESINALFIEDKAANTIPNISRFFKSWITLRKIPKGTNLVLCESSSNTFSGVLWKIHNPHGKLVLIASDPKWSFLNNMNFLKRNFYIRCLSKYDLIISTSPLMKQQFPEKIQKNTTIVFPFPDPEKFSTKKANINTKSIIYTGRLSKDKGADLVLEAFKIIKEQVKEAKMYFVGISSNQPKEGNLGEQLQTQNIPGVIYTGMVKDPETYMKNCSIFMSLARIDAANISVIESMSMGIIPIVSEGVGNKYIVEKISPELVVKDKEEASKLVLRIWKDKSKMREYSNKARIIAKEYTQKKSITLFRKSIDELSK